MAQTLEGFERRLRVALLGMGRIRLRKSWRQAAGIEWEEGAERVQVLWVEPYQRGIGWSVVHELSHWVSRHRMEGEGELEEPQVEGLANEAWKRIEASRARYFWWRKAIDARLVKGDL